MRYIKLNNEFVNFNEFVEGIYEVFIELSSSGEVQREIGINSDSNIIHKFPSDDFEYGKYGIFDLAKINLSENDLNELTKDDFEILWKKSFNIS